MKNLLIAAFTLAGLPERKVVGIFEYNAKFPHS